MQFLFYRAVALSTVLAFLLSIDHHSPAAADAFSPCLVLPQRRWQQYDHRRWSGSSPASSLALSSSSSSSSWATTTTREMTAATPQSSFDSSSFSLHTPIHTFDSMRDALEFLEQLPLRQSLRQDEEEEEEEYLVVKYFVSYCKVCQRAALSYKKIATEYTNDNRNGKRVHFLRADASSWAIPSSVNVNNKYYNNDPATVPNSFPSMSDFGEEAPSLQQLSSDMNHGNLVDPSLGMEEEPQSSQQQRSQSHQQQEWLKQLGLIKFPFVQIYRKRTGDCVASFSTGGTSYMFTRRVRETLNAVLERTPNEWQAFDRDCRAAMDENHNVRRHVLQQATTLSSLLPSSRSVHCCP
ncbi:hypothetical protein ACA910_004252 [Epithemia clementina (nom. ined.)]